MMDEKQLVGRIINQFVSFLPLNAIFNFRDTIFFRKVFRDISLVRRPPIHIIWYRMVSFMYPGFLFKINYTIQKLVIIMQPLP